MDRRAFLASAGVAGAVGLAGCGGLGGTGGSEAGGIDPVTVRTLDARGSSAGEMVVPVDGQVTVVDAFATWCAPCKPALDSLVAARERVGDDARFVSVTTEQFAENFTAADVADWWADHGGEWTVAQDAEGKLTRRLEATRLPTTVVTDLDRRVVWRHTGVPETEDVVENVENALS